MMPGEEKVPSIGSDSVSSLDPTSPRSIGKDPTNDRLVMFMRFFRAFTALGGLGISIGMFFTLMSVILSSFNLSYFILALYLCPLGIVIFIVEWEKLFYQKVIKWFPFLKTIWGRACFYLFVGGQCLALNSTQGYVLGISFLLISIVGCWYACSHGEPEKKQELDEVDVEQPQVTPATETSYASDPFPGETRSSLSGMAGAAAVSWAQENPEQARAAASFAFEQARENPEMAGKVAKAVM